MLLKVLISCGLMLMLAGFGAAGWQYWQTLPAGEAAEAAVAESVPGPTPETAQSWLISPTGGLVRREVARAFLVQDRFVAGRSVLITHSAALAALLLEGETLPEAAYLEVLADIRAPKVAGGFCAVLLDTIAADCAVNAARVVPGSVDRAAGTAQFRTELVYRLKPEAAPLPDLGSSVLVTAPVDALSAPDAEVAAEVAVVQPEAMLRSAISAVVAACDSPDVAKPCRMMRLEMIWTPDGSGATRAEIGWMAPLPKGMYPAPPLG